jgi:hypothetical protein
MMMCRDMPQAYSGRISPGQVATYRLTALRPSSGISPHCSTVYGKPWILHIPSSGWTKTSDELKPGEFCYGHESYADFSLGEGFDLKKFNAALSNVPSFRTAGHP